MNKMLSTLIVVMRLTRSVVNVQKAQRNDARDLARFSREDIERGMNNQDKELVVMRT